jgi:type I restriction enzyme S subunit
MIADLKPYPEYKESGVPWLGQVPRHWGFSRSKRLFSARKDLALPGDVQLSATQAYGVIPQSDFEEKVGRRVVKISMHLEKRRHVEKNDFVISMRSFQGGIERAWASGAIRSSYVVLKPQSSVNIGFFACLFKSNNYIRALQATADFIRDGQDLNFSNFCSVDLPTVPLAEQAAIVRFLDWANGRLERTMRSKRKVIALLNEQKQAIIHRAVTRGLDPCVALNPTGVHWLGDIPRHWEVRRLKSLSIVKRGASPRPIADMRYFSANGEYAWVRIKDVTASNRFLEITTERLSELGKSRSVPLEPGAIFLSIAGSVGKPIISKIKCCIHDGFVYFPQFKGNAEFLYYVFSSGHVYDGLGKLGTQLNLNTETVGNIRVPWPDMTEQGQIVAFLDRELRTFEVTITRLEREIELLREYRTRLVADVVTGKLDVREVAARLPDEVAPETAEDYTDLSDETEAAEEEAVV